MKRNDDYSDIINHKRHISKTNEPMPLSKRAAQFSPFKALTGFDMAVDEKARHTDKRAEPAEDGKRRTVVNYSDLQKSELAAARRSCGFRLPLFITRNSGRGAASWDG